MVFRTPVLTSLDSHRRQLVQKSGIFGHFWGTPKSGSLPQKYAFLIKKVLKSAVFDHFLATFGNQSLPQKYAFLIKKGEKSGPKKSGFWVIS